MTKKVKAASEELPNTRSRIASEDLHKRMQLFQLHAGGSSEKEDHLLSCRDRLL